MMTASFCMYAWIGLGCLLVMPSAVAQVCGSLSNYCSCTSSATMTATYAYQITPGNPMLLNICAINMCCNGCCGWVNSNLATGCAFFQHIYEYSHPGCPDASAATRYAPPSSSTYLGCWYAGYLGANIVDIPNGGNCTAFGNSWQNFLAPSSCPAGTYGYGTSCALCKSCSAFATATGSCPAGSFGDGITCTCNAGYVGDGVTCTAQGSGLLTTSVAVPPGAPPTTVIVKTLAPSPTAAKLALSTSVAVAVATSPAASTSKAALPATTKASKAAATTKIGSTTRKAAATTSKAPATRRTTSKNTAKKSTTARTTTATRTTTTPPPPPPVDTRDALGPRIDRKSVV